MTRDPATAYEQLIAHCQRLSTLGSVGSVLGWDQECMLPEQGSAHRAEQLALLAGLAHEWGTDPRIGEWLTACEGSDLVADPTAPAAVNCHHIRRAYDKATKLPSELVTALSRARSQAFTSWRQARESSSFAVFAPDLQRIIELTREQADALGHDGDRYDALLDNYEPGTATAQIETLFTPLAEALSGLLQEARGRELLHLDPGPWDEATQTELCRRALTAIGFDFTAGRLDPTVHPFCTGLGPDDTRLTTRFKADDPLDALSSALHEGGHGLYDQGLDAEYWGLPMGEAVSLGIHESQSRIYENQVGRSPGFARWLLPQLRELFPQQTGALDEANLTRVLNQVVPGFIRVESDEVAYNLHIVLRFEIERRLLDGSLAVADLPAAWNERFAELFGMDVPDDAQGCLQDVHWSHAAFGYFPTYTLGNVYGAQIFATAQAELGDLDTAFAAGEFGPLREWLRERIHSQGSRYTPPALVERVTGAAPDTAHLLAHLRERYLGPE